jgi:hypothetical protein
MVSTGFAAWLVTREATSEATEFAMRLAQAKHFARCLVSRCTFQLEGLRAIIGEILASRKNRMETRGNACPV